MASALPDSFSDALLDEVHGLTLACMSGEANAADYERLNAMLATSEAARRIYTQAVCDSYGLYQWATAQEPDAEDDPFAAESDSHFLESLADDSLTEGGCFGDPRGNSFHAIVPKTGTSTPSILPAVADGRFHGFVSGWPVAYLIATFVFAIGLALAALVHVSQPGQHVDHCDAVPNLNPQSPIPNSSSVVARITGMVDCEWEGSGFRGQGSEAANQKSEIRSDKSVIHLGDRLALKSGLLEITYDTGAEVILQGPVTYEVESVAGGYLSVGKLTAKLEKTSGVRGRRSESENQKSEIRNQKSPALCSLTSDLFAIRTPTAVVTDLGTEFGVEVEASGATRSHVFRGSVRLESIGAKRGASTASRILHANEAALVPTATDDGSRPVQPTTVDPTAFVRPAQFQKRADDSKLKSIRNWRTYSERLRHDPSLLAYYDFQQPPDSRDVLRNVAANGDNSLDGVLENAFWTVGRTAGKDALRFALRDTYVRIHLPQSVEDLTLTAWINVHSLDNPYSGLLMSETWGNSGGQVHWQLRNDGRIILAISGHTDDFHPYQSRPVFDRALLDRWTHVAAVYDHATASVRFYLNGQPIGEDTVPGHIPIRIGAARIGNWAAAGEDRNFRGSIDEMAIFRRTLTSDEIQRMFEAGTSTSVHRTSNGNREDL